MPKKTDEQTRERIIQLRGQGLSRAKIYSQLKTEGQPISPKTIGHTLKEAGLTDPTRFKGRRVPTPTVTPSTATETETPEPSPVAPVAVSNSTNGNGLAEYQPPPARIKTKPTLYARCSQCEAMHQFTADDPPKECLACGEAFE